MLLSLNWLSDLVDLSGLAPDEIAETLTMRTALVEGYEDQRAALAGVMVGEVVGCERHPDADRLSVCRVDYGGDVPAYVVCGAPNVAVGQKIVYAPVGTRLPNGLKLKKAKIRGQPSEGMICAEDEIGLGSEHDGTIELDPSLAAGLPIGEVPGLADVIFEIDNQSITQRPDLWGHYGFARELAAIFGRDLRPLEVDGDLQPGATTPAIELADPVGCPMYAGLCVEGRLKRSPDWMRWRLVACGMRPLGTLIDVSNYVMLELGQPTHPFDRDTLAGDRILVRRAESGETLTTLDDIERKLEPEDLVIADGSGGVALAGIMGSARCEVGEGTTRLFLESASFDAQVVRRTSSRLGLRSEALARFEKALDPALVEQAVRRYAWWLRQLDPDSKLEASFGLSGAATAPERDIALTGAQVRGLLGCDVADEKIVQVLEAVGFELQAAGEGWTVSVPSWRASRDVTLKEDLIEEVGRLVGYDAVPTSDPAGPLKIGRRDPLMAVEETLRDVLAGDLAFTETVAYSMASDSELAAAGWTDTARLPRLANPLQVDSAHLRPSPVVGLLSRLETWLRLTDEVRVFEVGRGYALDGTDVTESRQVVVLLARAHKSAAGQLVRELKGAAERAIATLGCGALQVASCEPGDLAPWLHPGRSARIMVADVEVGRLGEVSPVVLGRIDVSMPVGLLVLDAAVLADLPAEPTRFAPIGRYPAAGIDLAFVASYDISSDELAAAMESAGPRTLASVTAFDVYRGPPLDDGERSIAFHLLFQAKDRTLTDEDVGKARDKLVKAVEKLGARLR